MKIKIVELSTLIQEILKKKYYSDEEAKLMCDVFMYAELAGKNTQGILKLMGTEPAQDIQPQYKPKITKETLLSALIDGGEPPVLLSPNRLQTKSSPLHRR